MLAKICTKLFYSLLTLNILLFKCLTPNCGFRNIQNYIIFFLFIEYVYNILILAKADFNGKYYYVSRQNMFVRFSVIPPICGNVSSIWKQHLATNVFLAWPQMKHGWQIYLPVYLDERRIDIKYWHKIYKPYVYLYWELRHVRICL